MRAHTVTVRSEPRARLVSHLYYVMKLYTAWTRTSNRSHFRGKDAAYWRLFAPATTDNYAVRYGSSLAAAAAARGCGVRLPRCPCIVSCARPREAVPGRSSGLSLSVHEHHLQ